MNSINISPYDKAGRAETERKRDMEDDKGTVCVTGATGYVASWLIMRLLQHGYSVRATVRSHHAAGTYIYVLD